MNRRIAWSIPSRAQWLLAWACLILGAGQAHGQQKRIYIANDDHTDYMWTADVETYNRIFVDLLDFHSRLADQTAGEPAPYQSRFNTDGSHWLWAYERAKSPAEFQRLIGRVKDGQIGVPMNTLVSCYGGQPAEAVLRGMYYAGRLERRHGLRFLLAESMENQTQPLGLASLWAGSGARYSWKGVCACASKLSKDVLSHRNREIYWYTGQDGQRVLMKWYSTGPNYIGTYLEAENPRASIDFLDQDGGFLGRYKDPTSGKPYEVAAAFGFGGDTLARKTGMPADPGIPVEPGVQQGVIGWRSTDHFHVIARRESNNKRQVIVSNETDFFQDFEKNYGPTLPSESVTYGNEWDLYSASMAETTSRVKRAVEKLRAAELMASLVALKRPDFARSREQARDQAFTDLGLYWEHDWTADGPVSRPARAAWQNLLAAEIDYYVNTLHDDAAKRLGGLIPRVGTAARFFVLNPLGWPRTESADFAYRGSANIHVHDLTSDVDVPHQIVNLAGATYLRILASDVPSAGYKTYEIRGGPGTSPTDNAASVVAHMVENARVKLSIEADGAIGSLIDKARGSREMAANIGGLKLNDLAPNDAAGNSVVVANAGPVSVTLRCVSKAGLDHTTAITVYRDSDRVDIENRITANFADVRHWAFSGNFAEPDVHAEEVGAIIHAKLRSRGGDYADSHARYDYLTLNHFADMTDGAGVAGLTISNRDCSFAKLGKSTPAALDTITAQLNVLAGGQIDGPGLGIPSQNGATEFLQRFALRPHGAYDPVAAMRFALEHQNPLVAAPVIGDGTSPYPATTYSLLTISNPGVLLWALKPAEEGIEAGIIARVWNLAPTSGNYTVSFAPGLSEARRVTHIETNLGVLPVADGRVSSPIAAAQLQTLRLLGPAKRPR